MTAKAIVMPSSMDQYFGSDDSKDDVDGMHAEFTERPSVWGHDAPVRRDVAISEMIGELAAT